MINVSVCIGSSCHLRGSYNVIQTFQHLIEENLLYDKIDFVPLITSYGCVYKCKFCATQYMHPDIIRRGVDNVIKEICHWQERSIDKFVIYDDNFLYKKN